MTESVNVPRWSSDPTGADELAGTVAADRLFVAPHTTLQCMLLMMMVHFR